MMTIKNIKQFKELTSYGTVILERFWDGSSTASGGTFLWDPESVLTEIPGLIIKPTTAAPLAGGNKGRWVRQYSGAINVDWFGSSNKNQTMITLGISQVDADAIYGVGFCNVNVDTCDATAINYGLSLLASGYFSVEFTGTIYYINKVLEIPKVYSSSGEHYKFIISGNGCRIKAIANGSYTMMRRNIASNYAQSQTMQDTAVKIQDFKFEGLGNDIALMVGPSYSSDISNISVSGCNRAIHCAYTMNCNIHGIETTNCEDSVGVILVDIDPSASYVSGATGANHTSISKCRLFGGNSTAIGIAVLGTSGVVIQDCIVEGPGAWLHPIYFDSKDSGPVKYFECKNLHLEISATGTQNSAAIYVRPKGQATVTSGQGQVSISSIFGQYGKVLLEIEPVGECFVKVSDINYWLPSASGKYMKVTKINSGDNVRININNSPALPRDIDRNSNYWIGTKPLIFTELSNVSPPSFNGIELHHVVFDNISQNYYRYISPGNWQQCTSGGAQLNPFCTVSVLATSAHKPQ